jgi:DNA-binding CsgD family transcriptional regulator
LAAVGSVEARPVGRDEELAVLDQFLAAGGGFRGLVLVGGPGIGKSTLWETGVASAGKRGLRVLSARASGAEARLAFAGLIDLLEDVGDETMAILPVPQKRALDIALLRAEPEGAALEPGAIGLGLLHVVRAMAARAPVLVAIDDVHWLDPSSSDALGFACRRLATDDVRVLLSRRPDSVSLLEQAGPLGTAELLDVGPLSLGAIRQLLADRLGLSLPRQHLRRLVDSTLGNPLFALELGRVLAEHGLPAIGEELPVPDSIEELLGTRVARLPSAQRRLLLAVALSADPSASELAAIADVEAVETAVETGALVVDGERARASHPLLAAAALARSKASERRALHLELAEVAANEELRARHLALATDRPDGQLAGTIAAAAHAASGRGAWQTAAELGEHALRLTPADAPERPKRAFYVAVFLSIVGEKERFRTLITTELESLPPGPARARLWLLMPGIVENNDEILEYFERALEESRSDPALHAAVLGNLSFNATAIRVERIRDAEVWADQALPASRADPEIERSVLYALAKARSLRGRPFDDIRERFRAVSEATSYILGSPERIAGERLVWRGEVDPAREVHSHLLTLADARGDVQGYANLRRQACELELRAGEWERATRLLDEWADPMERESMAWPAFEHCQALLAAGRGLAAEAKRCATEELERGRAVGAPFHELEARRVIGLAELLAHEPQRAAESLRAVWEHAEREGVEEPGYVPVAPDLVEALVELGELEEAQQVTSRLRNLSEQQEHPWGLASVKRCEGIVDLAIRYGDEAVGALERAAADYELLGLRFDAARSLLALGRAQRRHRKWGAARRSLEAAEAGFADLGSPGWVDEARAELARVGARRPQPSGELTPAERRVAELAADGLANKEIAQTLFVSVKTVEGHLSHVYAKLGVRSRAQLARRLSAGSGR